MNEIGNRPRPRQKFWFEQEGFESWGRLAAAAADAEDHD
jgi:hypothetical protein